MKNRVYTFLLALLILVFGLNGYASNVQDDLADRFPAIPDVEIDGIGYVARQRTTTALLASYNAITGETGSHLLLTVDDDRKEIRKIYIDCNLLLPAQADSENAELPLKEIVRLGANPDEGLQRIVATLTAAMPLLTIDAYMAVDLSGLDVVDIDPTPLYELDDQALMDQLSASLLNIARQSDSNVNELYSRLGDALITDMKSGVAMRIYNKLDRYTIIDTVPLPTLAGAADAKTGLDLPAANQVLIDALYMPLAESLAGQIANQMQK